MSEPNSKKRRHSGGQTVSDKDDIIDLDSEDQHSTPITRKDPPAEVTDVDSEQWVRSKDPFNLGDGFAQNLF